MLTELKLTFSLSAEEAEGPGGGASGGDIAVVDGEAILVSVLVVL